jgi:glucose-1-phosphate adenylyltransferase
VYVSPGALVRESVIINDTWIGPGAVVDRSIVDANVVIGTGSHLGYGDDMTPNHELPDKVNTGITIVGSGTHVPGGVRIGRNVLINCDRQETEFPGIEIPSGETV